MAARIPGVTCPKEDLDANMETAPVGQLDERAVTQIDLANGTSSDIAQTARGVKRVRLEETSTLPDSSRKKVALNPGSTGILNQPDDMLCEMMKYLGLRDRISFAKSFRNVPHIESGPLQISYQQFKNLLDSREISDQRRGEILKNIEEITYLPITLSDLDLQQIATHCPHLKRLELNGWKRTNLAFLEGFKELEELRLYGCWEVTEQELQNIAGCCPKLKSLVFTGYDVTSLAFLEGLNLLQHLVLYGIRVPDQEMQNIARCCPKLKSLDLPRNPIKYLAFLEGLNELERLYLAECRSITDLEWPKIPRYCPKLKSLNFAGCRTENRTFFQGLNELEELILSADTTDEELSNIARWCPNLIKLNAWGCHRVTLDTISKFSKLQELIFRDVIITDLSPITKLRELRHLELSKCWRVADFTPLSQLRKLQYLRSHLPRGTYLELEGEALQKYLSSLREG